MAATTSASRAARSACRSPSTAAAPGSTRSGRYENSNSYYDGIYSKSKLGQIAVDMELAPRWRLEFGGQGYSGQRPQNIGWNRVTQDLVDNKRYLAGTPLVNLSSNGNDLAVDDLRDGAAGAVRVHQEHGRRCSGSYRRSPPGRSLFKLDPVDGADLVTLSHDQIFVDSPDFSDAFTVTGLLRRHQRGPAGTDAEEPDVLRPDGSHEVQHLRVRCRLQPLGDREQDQPRLHGAARPRPSVAEHARVRLPLLGRVRRRVTRPGISGDRSARRLARRASRTTGSRARSTATARFRSTTSRKAPTATPAVFLLSTWTSRRS